MLAGFELLQGRNVSIRSPRRGEGRSIVLVALQHVVDVSIRSPRRGEGRSACMEDTVQLSLFQSAPPAEARGDVGGPCDPNPGSRFNPLPPPRRGEMQRLQPEQPGCRRFNPLPPPRRGEMLVTLTD